MALSATDQMKLRQVLDGNAGVPLTFQGDRLDAVNYGISLCLKVWAPLLTLVGDEPGPKPQEETSAGE